MAEITTGAGEPEGRPDATTPLPPVPQGPGAWEYARPAAAAAGAAAPAPAATPARRRAGAVHGAGLVVAGLLVGALVATATHGRSTSTAAASSPAALQGSTGQGAPPQDGTGPGGLGPGPGALSGGGRGGGVAGETRVVGTVTAVGAGSVTVRAADGASATYRVDADTEIAKAGAAVALDTLQAGDRVLVLVLPGGVAERVLVGASAGSATAPGGPAGSTGGAPATTA